jgi:hypothetical protein
LAIGRLFRAGGAAAALASGLALSACGQQPLVRWTFDGAAATNCGTGGMAYDAALSGAVAFTNGVEGGGLHLLGGSEGYAALSHPFGDQGAVAFWYKPTRFYNYNSLFDNSVDPNKWEMWLDSGANVRFRLTGGQGDIAYGNMNSQHNGSNVWYHFAVTWDRNAAANQARLYVNGVERYATNITAWVTPGNTVYFGGHTGNAPGEGVLDDVRVYTNALTGGQVQSLHAEVAARAPVVHLTLDGVATNSGTFGAKGDATLFGAPAWTNGWNNKGLALALDGVDDYASVPFRLNFSGSVALWCYAPGPWYNYNSIFDNSADANHYECWIDETGTLHFRPAGNAWKQSASHNLGSGSNRWYHIVGTWDALSSNMVLYVNGVERGRAVNTNGAAWPTPGSLFYLGGGQAANTNALNVTSDVQIYETPLSSNRVAEIYGEFGRRGGLLAHVPFDGAAVDVAGSNAVVLAGAPVYVKTQGGLLQGLSCGGVGSGDYAAISNVLGSSVGTLALWYYARGPWYNWQTVLDNPVYQEYWESWVDSNGYLKFRVSNKADGGLVQVDLDGLKGSNTWYHIAYVWDREAQQTRLYVDGVLRASATLSPAGWVNPDPTLNLAGGHPSNTKGNGIWDEMRVYDRALSAAEIGELMVIPPPPPPRGTLITLH